MAEGIMKDLIKQHQLDWEVESAGTESYHVGQSPDARAIRTCKNHAIDISSQRARQICKKDCDDFDLVYALGTDILEEIGDTLPSLSGNSRLKLLLDEVFPGGEPFSTRSLVWEGRGIEPVFQLIEKACQAILKKHAGEAIRK
jgi:protein-tyrosine phosphatase